MKLLLVGESWTIHTTHIKGVDCLTSCSYEESAVAFKKALADNGIEVHHMPSHIALNSFPGKVSDLKQYDAVVLSDIGSNTLLLCEDTTVRSLERPNRLNVIKQYVSEGGGFAMMGGYMSFQGIDAKARYKDTAIEEILPAELLQHDDRFEAPEGVGITIMQPDHEILSGIPDAWPRFLGFNKLLPKDGCDVLATCAGYVFMASRSYGRGRTFAFASDLAPHWAPPVFLEWEHYGRFFCNAMRWIAQK